MNSLFVVGDSISIQYGPYLKQMLTGTLLYDRKRGEEEALIDLDKPVGANGGDSSMVLEYFIQQRSLDVHYDVLLVNCGLHDIKTDPNTAMKQVSIEQYVKNVEAIVQTAKELAQHMIWVRTTDAVEHIHNTISTTFYRFHEDVIAYNAAADAIMARHHVPVIDLYTFTKTFGHAAYCDHVHYKDEICRLQAAFIAGCLQTLTNSF